MSKGKRNGKRKTVSRNIWFSFYHVMVQVTKDEFDRLIERGDAIVDEVESTDVWIVADAVDPID